MLLIHREKEPGERRCQGDGGNDEAQCRQWRGEPPGSGGVTVELQVSIEDITADWNRMKDIVEGMGSIADHLRRCSRYSLIDPSDGVSKDHQNGGEGEQLKDHETLGFAVSSLIGGYRSRKKYNQQQQYAEYVDLKAIYLLHPVLLQSCRSVQLVNELRPSYHNGGTEQSRE